MKFKDFLFEKEKGTYVAVKFTEETNKNLKKYAEDMGLKAIKSFHATIVFSKKSLGVPHSTTEMSGKLTPKGLMYLGEENNKWRAIVIEVNSAKLQERFDFYSKEYGYKSNYDGYLQHVSLAYSPPEGMDLKDIPLPDFDIVIDHEYVEDID